MKTKAEILAGIAGDVCDKMGLVPVAVLSAGNHNPKAVEARRVIASTLYGAGFSSNDIASLMKVHRATVVNHLRRAGE